MSGLCMLYIARSQTTTAAHNFLCSDTERKYFNNISKEKFINTVSINELLLG